MTTCSAGRHILMKTNLTKMVPVNTADDAIYTRLKEPYARLVVPEADGSYRAEILEFPGCIATGTTATEALENLEKTAQGWLLSAMELGQTIPRPVEVGGFSGKLMLRLPKGLHKKASLVAEREGVSLNNFIMCAVAEQVGERARTQILYSPSMATVTICRRLIFQPVGESNYPVLANKFVDFQIDSKLFGNFLNVPNSLIEKVGA